MKITLEQLKQLIQQEVAKAKSKLYYWEDNGQPKQFKNNIKVVEGKKNSMSEQAIRRSHPDLSKIEGSFSYWLERHLPEIEKKHLYSNEKKASLIDLIKTDKEKGDIKMSDKYMNSFFEKLNKMNNPTKILQFLYNAYLEGSNLGLHEQKEHKLDKIKNDKKAIKKNN